MPEITYAEEIRLNRARNELTQAELAERTGVTPATVSHWETGRSVPRVQQKQAIADALHLPPTPEESAAPHEPDGTTPSPLGEWLNRQRLESRVSVAELADASGVSTPSIYNIESGRITNPRRSTIQRLEKALGKQLPSEARREIRERATIEGVGELIEFDPHDDENLPAVPGIYVLYDISDRPIYVGQASNIRTRIRSHQEKFWFKQPIVQTAALVKFSDIALRKKVETLLIRFLRSNAVINKQGVDR